MPMDLGALVARCHLAFNDRDFDVWREVFDEDVDLLIDGLPFRGVDAAVAYAVDSVSQFPELYIASERTVAETDDTIVSEIGLVSGDPASGHSRRTGTACEICRVRDGRIVSFRSYYTPEPTGRADAVRMQARAETGMVAEEQAALRRVATLVASGVSPEAVFAVVAEEVGRLVEVDFTILSRCEPEDEQVSVGTWNNTAADVPVPRRHPGASRRAERRVARGPDGPAGADRRLRRCLGDGRGCRTQLAAPLGGRRADQRRGPVVGGHGRGVRAGAADAGEH